MKYIGITLAAFISLQAKAVVYVNKMDESDWAVRGTPLECKLSQDISKAMSAEFYQNAGEPGKFKGLIKRSHNVDNVQLSVESPFWHNEKMAPYNVTETNVENRQFILDESVAEDMLVNLQNGLVASFQLSNGDQVKVLPTGFGDALERYNECLVDLSPYGYNQVGVTVMRYPSGEAKMDDINKAELDKLVAYFGADPSIERIVVDGHSDSGGRSLINRDLSKKRAELTAEYLLASGIPSDKVVLRFHGDMYPIASNASKEGRDLNRRVVVRLQKKVKPPRKPASEMDIYDHYIETRKLMKNLGGIVFKSEDEVFNAIEANEIIDALNPASDTLRVETANVNGDDADVKEVAKAIESISGIDADQFVGNEDGLKEAIQNAQEQILEDSRVQVEDRVTLSAAKTPEKVVNDRLGNFEENLLTDQEMLTAKRAMNEADSLPVERETIVNEILKADEAQRIANAVSKDEAFKVFEDNGAPDSNDSNSVQGQAAPEEKSYNPFKYFGKSPEEIKKLSEAEGGQ